MRISIIVIFHLFLYLFSTYICMYVLYVFMYVIMVQPCGESLEQTPST